jgi:hypothetical protein
MRDVINPIGLIVLIIFALGIMVDALGATPTRSEVVPTTEQLFPNVKTIDEIFGDNGAALSAQIAKIDKLEAVINSRQELRDLYHGGKPVQVITTNLETRIIQRQDKYPDGYIHIEKAWERKVGTPMTEAQRKTAVSRAKSNRIKSLEERCELLSKSTNAVDAANLAKCQKLLKRLKASSTTNYVDITVYPPTTGGR